MCALIQVWINSFAKFLHGILLSCDLFPCLSFSLSLFVHLASFGTTFIVHYLYIYTNINLYVYIYIFIKNRFTSISLPIRVTLRAYLLIFYPIISLQTPTAPAIQVLWHSRPVKALTADIKPPLLVGNPVETRVKDETVVKPTRGRVEVVT